jgi:peptidoglycan/xylan/chitin deacetylase (PgdA/CDA1 family)
MKTHTHIIPALVLFGTAALLISARHDEAVGYGGAEPSEKTSPIGILPGDPLARLGLKKSDLQAKAERVRFVGITRYLNNSRAVVTHTIDDSSKFVPGCIDAMDKYGIKATIFVSTRREPISTLWPRLRDAAGNGHEIGSHSRTHRCKWPDTPEFCQQAYSDEEISGSRDDILANTEQPYVWSWAYPCGNCAQFDFVHARLAHAGYVVARNYPGEEQDKHVLPDLQSYALNPYSAAYTQVVQKVGGIAKTGRTEISELNAKFDQVHQRTGIYSFLSHPQWLDYGPENFYEKHLAHLGGRADVWYVPMGPLYAYRTLRERTRVSRLEPVFAKAAKQPKRESLHADRFAIYNDLDPKIFNGSITLEFSVSENSHVEVMSNERPIVQRSTGITDRWNDEYFRGDGRSLFVTIRPNAILEIRAVN